MTNGLYFELEGSGPPLVMIPGYGCDHTIFDSVRQELAAGHQLILLDNRGVGRSAPMAKGMTLEAMADDIHALLDDLNVHKASILGHSMGGAIAALFAYRYPERVESVIHGQGVVKLRPRARRALEAQLNMAFAAVSERLTKEMLIPLLLAQEASDELVEELLLPSPYPPTPENLACQLEAVKQFDMRSIASNIRVPLLFLTGDQDLLCPKEDALEMAMLAPKSRYFSVERAGHLAHIESKELFLGAVRQFLAGK